MNGSVVHQFIIVVFHLRCLVYLRLWAALSKFDFPLRLVTAEVDLLMPLDPRNHCVVRAFVIFVSHQIVFVDLLLCCTHVSISFERLLQHHLLVQFVSIHVLLSNCQVAPFFLNLLLVLRLSRSLDFVEFLLVLQLLLFLILTIINLPLDILVVGLS